jgi:hypothetical protein
MDIFYVVLTFVFFALSWVLLKLCGRLMANGKSTSTHDG